MFYLHLGSQFCQLHPYFLLKGPLCHLNCQETVSEVNFFQTPAGSQLLSSADYTLAYYTGFVTSAASIGPIVFGCLRVSAKRAATIAWLKKSFVRLMGSRCPNGSSRTAQKDHGPGRKARWKWRSQMGSLTGVGWVGKRTGVGDRKCPL